MRVRSLVGLTLLFMLPGAAAALAAVDGDLDRGFDGDGKLLTDFGGTSANSVLDSAVDANGKLVVVGGASDIEVARFNPDGTPDTTFDGDGFATVDSGTTTGGERARAVAIQSDGKIVLAGDANVASSGNTMDSVFARLNSNGTLDNTFDGPAGTGNGVFRISTGTSESVNDVAVNGTKMDFGGTRNAPLEPLIGQLNASDGTLDSGFGTSGLVTGLNFPGGSGSFITGLAVQSDGKLIAAGAPNGATGYGVARINTDGTLDTAGFNAPNGYRVASLPTGYIDATATDVLVDSGGGTVVAGQIESGSPTFNNDPFISRLTSAGAVDSAFGTSGYTIVPAGANTFDAVGFQSISAMSDGRLIAAGNDQINPDPAPLYFTQLVARFTSGGALDSTFSPADGKLTSDLGVSAFANSVSLSPTGIAYAVGQGSGSVIAISAVCADASTGCPSPEMPIVQSVTPPSGSNDNAPRVSGSVPVGEPATSVGVYTNAACSGAPAATGSEADFESGGIPVSVADNSTTTFYALAEGVHAPSPCSATSVTYTEVTPPPAPPASGPTGQRARALRKCKKIKNEAKRRKCKKRARKLPI